jgi:hypothetical protein
MDLDRPNGRIEMAEERDPGQDTSSTGVPDVTGPLPGADVPGVVAPPPDYSDGVPSLDFVRDKIEGRFARSLGSAELAGGTPEAKSAAEQQQEREKAARDKLEAIRQSLHGGTSSSP